MATVRRRTWKTAKGEARIAFALDFVDANGERQRLQFATKREADAKRVEIESQLRGGTYRADAAKVTLKDAADQFLEHCAGRRDRGERMTRRNYEVYEGHIRNYICPDPARHEGKRQNKRLIVFREGIGALKLAQLNTRQVGDFRDRLRNAGVSVVTTRKILATFQLVLNFAISRDLVASNAAKGVKVIGRRDEGAKKIVPPSKEAVRALIAIADADFRVVLMLATGTGVRAGEMHALRWRHIDFEEGELTIETRVDSYGEEDVTKTAAGMRTVPLSGPLILALKAWKLRSGRSKADDLLFPSCRGWYLGHDNMVKRKFDPLFKSLAKQHADAPEKHPPAPARFNWHALRHFAVSCWIDAGLSPKTVQTFAGHSSLQVTMDRYGHMFKSDDHRRAMDDIAKQVFTD